MKAADFSLRSFRYRARSLTKQAVVKLGERTPVGALHSLNRIVNYLEAGAFVRRRGFDTNRRGWSRFQVFDLIASEVARRQVLYLEFGVASGRTIRYWSKLLLSPGSVLDGFDSFEGLPTNWIRDFPAGFFSTDGQPPDVDDQRVRFFKGWFQDTLPAYTPPEHDLLVVNCDADLYSSTVTILNTIEPWLTPGSFIYFDEFNNRYDEMRAFDEFLDRTSTRFELYAASRDLGHAAFRVVPGA